jgi:hypothetical protein
MPTTTISPNMQLPVPVVGVDPGPDWATQINNCLALIDSHTHVTGQGVQITPSGLDINADLSIGGNNLTLVRSTRFQNQATTLSGVTDLNCVYSSGTAGDLYYNDGSGNIIRLTQSGSIVGTTGSIGGLVSPASATYVPATQTFVWQSAANTAANMDCGSVILRNITASSYGLTLAPPSSLALNYTVTLPAIPAASGNFLTIDTSGNISSNVKIDGVTLLNTSNTIAVQASQLVDNSTTEASSNQIIVKDGGITSAKLAANSVTTTAITNANVTTAKLDATVQGNIAKAWINFNGDPLSGTYTQSGTTVTVSATSHGMVAGQKFYIDITSGTAVDGAYVVATAATNSFTYTAGTSLSTSGNMTIQARVNSSYNISSVTYSPTSLFTINFSTAFSNVFYTWSGSATRSVSPTFFGIVSESVITARTTSAMQVQILGYTGGSGAAWSGALSANIINIIYFGT